MKKYSYLLIPEIRIQNANAQPVWWIVGPPAITAYMGFCIGLGRTVGIVPDGVAILHHDISFVGEAIHGSFRPSQFKSVSFVNAHDYIAGTTSLSSQPTARCHQTVSLVIRFEIGSVSDDALLKFLRNGRLSGGDILDNGRPVLLREGEESVLTEMEKIGRTHWSISDRSDLMVRENGDRDNLDTLLRLTRRNGISPVHSWLMPSMVGYSEISSRKYRNNVRGGMLHAYAEPIVGLVQFNVLRDVGLQFWSPSYPMRGVFLYAVETKQQLKEVL